MNIIGTFSGITIIPFAVVVSSFLGVVVETVMVVTSFGVVSLVVCLLMSAANVNDKVII